MGRRYVTGTYGGGDELRALAVENQVNIATWDTRQPNTILVAHFYTNYGEERELAWDTLNAVAVNHIQMRGIPTIHLAYNGAHYEPFKNHLHLTNEQGRQAVLTRMHKRMLYTTTGAQEAGTSASHAEVGRPNVERERVQATTRETRMSKRKQQASVIDPTNTRMGKRKQQMNAIDLTHACDKATRATQQVCGHTITLGSHTPLTTQSKNKQVVEAKPRETKRKRKCVANPHTEHTRQLQMMIFKQWRVQVRQL